MNKTILFSSYIDIKNIETIPKEIELIKPDNDYRYSITIPFKNRKKERVAIIIMKNPSKAGIYDHQTQNKISDETIYNVCDYIYKHKYKFSKVIILNLFPIYGSTFKNIAIKDQNEYLGHNLNTIRNDEIITEVLTSINDYTLILAWGGYPDMGKKSTRKQNYNTRKLYRQRINQILNIIGDRPTYKVGSQLTNNIFPSHGKVWFDFEELETFSHTKFFE